ncbi:MAG: ion channel [Thermonemataceae bacterium]
MSNPTKDPGFGRRYFRKTQRLITASNSFNVKRVGKQFSFKDLYVLLTEMNWLPFICWITLSYFLINALFGLTYLLLGEGALKGIQGNNEIETYLNAFYFSAQTFTTVGYGSMSPQSDLANLLAATQAYIGFVWFALITGLIYGRFASPKPKILFSKNVLIAPYKEMQALEFRVVNERSNVMIEMEVEVILSFNMKTGNFFSRSYYRLNLEMDRILFFPLPWTIVHPIDEQSPLYHKTAQQLTELETEVLVLLKGYDKSYRDVVRTIHSYQAKEIIWDARFVRNFYPQKNGKMIVDLSQISEIEHL